MPDVTVVVRCQRCGQKNRVRKGVFSRCGKCKREFSAEDVAKAQTVETIGKILGDKLDFLDFLK